MTEKRIWIGLALFLWTSCSSSPLIPVPSAGPEALPISVLKTACKGVYADDFKSCFLLRCLADFYDLSEKIAQRMWKGWKPKAAALGIRVTPSRWFLLNHKEPPPDMKYLDQNILNADVFCGSRLDVKNLCAFRGQRTCALDLSPIREIDPALLISQLLYLNHCFLFNQSPAYPMALEQEHTLFIKGLLRMEYGALRSFDWVAFIKIRTLRRSYQAFPEIIHEKNMESGLGLAWYTVILGLQEAEKHGAFKGFAPQGQAGKMLDRLFEGNEFIALGAAQALMLDKLRPSWKRDKNMDPEELVRDFSRQKGEKW